MRRTVTKYVEVDVEVDVDLDDFDDKDLIEELVSRGTITKSQGKMILRGNPVKAGVDLAEVEVATCEIRMGRKREALIHLERALGHDWIGRLQ